MGFSGLLFDHPGSWASLQVGTRSKPGASLDLSLQGLPAALRPASVSAGPSPPSTPAASAASLENPNSGLIGDWERKEQRHNTGLPNLLKKWCHDGITQLSRPLSSVLNSSLPLSEETFKMSWSRLLCPDACRRGRHCHISFVPCNSGSAHLPGRSQLQCRRGP